MGLSKAQLIERVTSLWKKAYGSAKDLPASFMYWHDCAELPEWLHGMLEEVRPQVFRTGFDPKRIARFDDEDDGGIAIDYDEETLATLEPSDFFYDDEEEVIVKGADIHTYLDKVRQLIPAESHVLIGWEEGRPVVRFVSRRDLPFKQLKQLAALLVGVKPPQVQKEEAQQSKQRQKVQELVEKALAKQGAKQVATTLNALIRKGK